LRLLGFFLTWWGAAILAALDSSMLFFLPFGIDTVVIYLAARDERFFWIYPLLAAAGSLVGAAITYWVGHKAGEVGLERLVPEQRLRRIRARVRESGAVAMAAAALLPPPFPLTPFVLTCGALNVDRRWFFITFGVARLIRFGAEAGLARIYGRGILRVFESDTFRTVIVGFVWLAVIGTIISAVLLWRNTQRQRLRPA
jgi:membrane protein YqaA with SNARE-associated domain